VDAANPDPPPILSTSDTPGVALGVFLVGDAVYVCDDAFGVQIVNKLDPTSPTIVGNLQITGARHMAVQNEVAFVAGENVVQLVDVSHPFSPMELADALPPALRVTVQDSLVFLAQERAGITVFLVRPGQRPLFLQNINSSAVVSAFDVATSASYAYVAWGTAGLQVIDITRLGAPNPIAVSHPTLAAARGVALFDHYVLLAVSTAGLQIVDVQVPTAPVDVATVETPGSAAFVFVERTFAYVADETGGVQIVDLRDPSAPKITGTLSSTGVMSGVTADPDFVFAVDRDDGLIITDAQCNN
jgi:hypothetical protein